MPFSYQLDRVKNNVLGKSRYEKFASAKTGMSLTTGNARMDLHDSKNNKFGEKYIGLRKDSKSLKYIVRIPFNNKYTSKQFKTLEEAIEYRNNYCILNKIIYE